MGANLMHVTIIPLDLHAILKLLFPVVPKAYS